MAERQILNEYKSLIKPGSNPWVRISLKDDNIFLWDVALMVLNPDSLYYGGYYKGEMRFPKNYPYSPPDFRFLRPLLHPNIYTDGKLCISILHPPGEDEQSGETAAERWSPVQNAYSVLLSIVSLLDDAEVSSPANVDAGILLRKDPEAYKKQVRKDKETSLADVPAGFVIPTHDTTKPPEKEFDDPNFWYEDEEEEELDLGGSDDELEDEDLEEEDEDAGFDDDDDDMYDDEQEDEDDELVSEKEEAKAQTSKKSSR